jgi:hypothetical protein
MASRPRPLWLTSRTLRVGQVRSTDEASVAAAAWDDRSLNERFSSSRGGAGDSEASRASRPASPMSLLQRPRAA